MAVPIPNLTILCGMPGCGKSTWAQTMLRPNNPWASQYVKVISSDSIRRDQFGELTQSWNDLVFGLFHYDVWRFLHHDFDVIADSTALRKSSREKLIELARDTGAYVHLVWFKNSDEAISRNRTREGEARVPDEAMERMHQNYLLSALQIPQEEYDSVTEIKSFRGITLPTPGAVC